MLTCAGVGSSTQATSSASSSTPAGNAFTVKKSHRTFGGAIGTHVVDMNATHQLAALEGTVVSFGPVMADYKRRRGAYKFHVIANIMFHKAVDPNVGTQPPVALRSPTLSVYPADHPQLGEVAREILDKIEVYEHIGSGWFFRVAGACIVSLESRCVCVIAEMDSRQACCRKCYWDRE